MVDNTDRKYDVGPPSKAPLERTKAQKSYFFLDGKLYKMLRQERASDLLTAWEYEQGRVVQFILSDAKRRMKNAYETKEVARLLNRRPEVIQTYVNKSAIVEPVRAENPKDTRKNKYGKSFRPMKWSEDDIIALHEYLLSHGGGRPRKDGTMYQGARLPTRRELLAMLRHQPTFYMRTASGEVVPVWSAYNEV